MTEEKKSRLTQSQTQKELENAAKQFDQFEENLKELSMDRLKAAPNQDAEMQTQLSEKELTKSNDIYLKPKRTFAAREKFNEKFRKDYEFAKEYVQFIAENREIIGETITLWVKKFPGQPVEEWEVPCNKPVWGPRYLAERIKECNYHRFVMEQKQFENNTMGTMYGTMAVDTTVQRLDAYPVSQRKSVFMNSTF